MTVNMNRDYLVIADLKTSKVTAPKMHCHNLDEGIFNIFLKLQMVMSDNRWLQTITHEDADNFTCELTIVKPSMQLKHVTGEIMNNDVLSSDAIFQFDLPADCTDNVGTCVCELSVTCDVNGKKEKVICDSFTYEVKASKVTDLNDEIESNPDLPVLTQLIEDVKDIANVQVRYDETTGNLSILQK